MTDRRTKLSNAQLVAVYLCLQGDISHTELAERLGKTRTNSYYYIGRAVAYWLRTGVLRFKLDITPVDLGGNEAYSKFLEKDKQTKEL